MELVKQFLLQKPLKIIATCRNKSEELNRLSEENRDILHVLTLELKDHSSFSRFAEQVEEIVGVKNGLNLLINNAAFEPREDEPTPDSMQETFNVNGISPYFLTKALLPLIKKASENNAEKAVGINRAAIIMMSSSVGSIEENKMGKHLAYRCSKTALNMAMKHLSIEVQNDNILVMSMHPGWVKTDMGGPNALISVETCCSTMLRTLSGLTKKDHGAFIRYNKTPIRF